MKISIISVVKDDPGIENTLRKLMNIKELSKEEIIVVDGSNHRLDYIRMRFPTVNWIDYENENNKKVTIAEQRNLGVVSSHGDIIIFIDANCVPQKNWFSELIKPVLEDDENIVAGNVKPFDSKTINTISDEKYKGKYLDEAPTINLLIKKIVFEKIGNFDIQMSYGEDVDFMWRARDSGFKIRYAKHAVVLHNWGNLSEQLRRSFKYGRMRAILFSKHPKKILTFYRNENLSAVIYPIYILMLPVTFLIWYYPFFILIPLIKNINSNPIKNTLFNLVFGLGVLKEFFLLSARYLFSRFSNISMY